MCLIIYKKSTSEYDHDYIKKCVNNSSVKNNKGYGFAIKNDDSILVKKGFKDKNSLLKSLSWYHKNGKLDDKLLVIHLRNASPGTSSNIRTTHPIMSGDEENGQKKVETRNAILIHNGYLSEFRSKVNMSTEDTSDTLLFAQHYLSNIGDFDFMQHMKRKYEDKFNSFYGLYKTGNNKLVILKAKRPPIIFGSFHESESTSHKGYFFSNDSYRDSFPSEFLSNLESEEATKSFYKRPSNFGQNTAFNDDNDFDNIDSTTKTHKTGGVLVKDRNMYMNKDYSFMSTVYNYTDHDQTSYYSRFYYRSNDLNETYPDQDILRSLNPFACYNNSQLANKGCCLEKALVKGCCNKLSNFHDTNFRQYLHNFISKRLYLKLDDDDKKLLGYSTIEVLTAIDSSTKKIVWYWTECKECGTTKKDKEDCKTCRGVGLTLGIAITLGKKSHVIDCVDTDYVIYGSKYSEKVTMKMVIRDLIHYVKEKTKPFEEIKNERKNSKECGKEVCGE